MFSVSSESPKASGREAVVWTKMSFLNAADSSVVCFKKGLKFKFFGSYTFSILVADVEVVAGHSLPATCSGSETPVPGGGPL